MRTMIIAAALAFAVSALGTPAHAASCSVEAGNKKLAGAAKTSFLTKCENDAKAACDKQAGEKKLAGAAKTSFTGKCVRDAVGG